MAYTKSLYTLLCLIDAGFVPTVELLVKERLTGAIILVIVIVLLVPELLSGPKGKSAPAPAATGATPSEEPPLKSYTINLNDDSRSRAATGNNGPAMPQPSGPEQTAVTGNAAGESQSGGAGGSGASTVGPSQSAAMSAPAASASQSASPAQTVTQTTAPDVGVAHTAAQAGAQSGAAHTPAHTAQRVAAAPPRATSAPASTQAQKSEGGWAVQLGVFRNRENAERLATDVRTKGFKVSVSPLTTGSGKRYRVRVGPAPDRAAAQEMQARLKAKGHPDGTVVPPS